MNPLRVAAGVVSLLSEMVAREYRKVQFPHWPDGEQPLIDGSGIADTVWATMPQQSSAESTAPEAGVDVAEKVPTPGRAHTPGVGHPACVEEAVDVAIKQALKAINEFTFGPPTAPAGVIDIGPNPGALLMTNSLAIAAAIGLREFAESNDCETPTFWKSIADQLDPK